MTNPVATGLSHVEQMMGLISGGAMSQAIAVAAELGLADQLTTGPRNADEIARLTGCHAPSMYRLLRALVSVDFCSELEDGRFALAGGGALMRTGPDGGFRSFMIWWGRYRWRVWGNLLHSVRTGERAGGAVSGTIGMMELDQDPDAARIFHGAMADLSRAVAADVVRTGDFAGLDCLVDVGGGHGELLTSILINYPAMRGMLFDQPHAIEGARRNFDDAGVGERCTTCSGDFFASVPRGGDGYILKSILHDWDDERSAVILRNCRAAMRTGTRLWLVEQVMPTHMSAGPRNGAVQDLNMLVMLGGRERTAAEFRALLEGAGFRLERMTDTALFFSVIEAVAVEI